MLASFKIIKGALYSAPLARVKSVVSRYRIRLFGVLVCFGSRLPVVKDEWKMAMKNDRRRTHEDGHGRTRLEAGGKRRYGRAPYLQLQPKESTKKGTFRLEAEERLVDALPQGPGSVFPVGLQEADEPVPEAHGD